MLQHDSANLSVLYIGGTGTVSASCVRLSVETGMRVAVLNRGTDRKQRPLPDAVERITADVTDDASLEAALDGRVFDVVVDFLAFDDEHAERAVRGLGSHARQYVYKNSPSV